MPQCGQKTRRRDGDKGVPFIEGDNSWHKRTPTKEELALALEALGGNA